MIRLLGYFFAIGAVFFLVVAGGFAWYIEKMGSDLPDYQVLAAYEPPVTTRVHAADGSLMAEYARQRRLFLPIQAVPDLVKNAFLSAEDKNFYQHPGVDIEGVARAVMVLAKGGRMQGASTITQQVAKNFLLTNERTFDRKIKEAILSLRIEQAYSKDKILELYLNEIYLGLGSYGVAAAALAYFDKSVNELTIEEAANEMTMLVHGLYGKELPRQNGAPLRLIVPWKYGLKNIKSIVRFEFTAERPPALWNDVNGHEYSWHSNVEPDVPHPRWSQASERLIPDGERVLTKLYNGYADQVGHLYER